MNFDWKLFSRRHLDCKTADIALYSGLNKIMGIVLNFVKNAHKLQTNTKTVRLHSVDASVFVALRRDKAWDSPRGATAGMILSQEMGQ